MCRSMRSPATFMLAVRFHLFLAAVLTLHILLLAGIRVASRPRASGRSAGLALALVALVVCASRSRRRHLDREIRRARLGAPVGFGPSAVAIQDGGWLQTHVITAHVAIGSLILATSRRARAVCPATAGRRRVAAASRSRANWRLPYESPHDYTPASHSRAHAARAAGSRALPTTSSSPSRGSSCWSW